MHEDTISKVSNAAKGKVELLRESKARYLMSAGLAGLFIGFGIMLIFVISGLLGKSPATKIVMGVAFPVALSLVVALGVELFTGNNMVGFAGFLNRAITGKELIELWIFSYIGNLIGSIIGGALFVFSGVATPQIVDTFVKAGVAKTTAPAGQFFLEEFYAIFLSALPFFLE